MTVNKKRFSDNFIASVKKTKVRKKVVKRTKPKRVRLD